MKYFSSGIFELPVDWFFILKFTSLYSLLASLNAIDTEPPLESLVFFELEAIYDDSHLQLY